MIRRWERGLRKEDGKESSGWGKWEVDWCKGKIRRRAGVIRIWERELRKEDGKEIWCK